MEFKYEEKRNSLQPATVKLTDEDIANVEQNEVCAGYSSVIGDRETQQGTGVTGKSENGHFTYAVVCDGMGGMQSGEIASKAAVDYFGRCLSQLAQICSTEESSPDIREELFNMMRTADSIVNKLEDDNGSQYRCGTTAAICVIENNMLFWTSVGDSRIYLVRGEDIFVLTNEHNYDFMAEKRKDDEDFTYDSKARGDALVSYLGLGRLPYIDLNAEPLQLADGDKIILCSDGLYKSLSDEQIKGIFLSEEENMERAASMLTTAALMNQSSNRDNTTVIVLKYINQQCL